jgi:D-amino-acid dehydrogenase
VVPPGRVPEGRQSEEEVVRVLVIGAGAIGSATALELARRGAAVTVIDRAGIGEGCSYGNAGWLTPCLAFPLPAPGVVRTGLKWLLDAESPLYIKPEASLEWARWLLGFVRAATPELHESGTAALVPLSRYSLESFARLDREYPGSFGFSPTGLLLVAQTAAGLASATHEAQRMEAHGTVWRRLDADGVRELEPAVTGELAGGIFFPQEAHCEPHAVVQTLARAATAAGAHFEPHTEVFVFRRDGRRLAAVRTTRGWMEADQFVLATGSWSAEHGRQLGFRLPVRGGKGYAITVDSLPRPPHLPLKVLERRIAITPRDGSTRLAGTLELVDGDESIAPRRVDAIVRSARTVLDVPESPHVVELWRGLRPCTPDGLPVIGLAPGYENLLVATGHQMCGLHTAPGTGRLAADLLTGEKPLFAPAPFRAERF